MTKWEDLPQWAKDKAKDLMHPAIMKSYETSPLAMVMTKQLAIALVEQDRIAEARGLEKAAQYHDAVSKEMKIAALRGSTAEVVNSLINAAEDHRMDADTIRKMKVTP